MPKIPFLLGCGVGVVFLVGACGESQDSPTRLGGTLGGVKEGAPLGPPIVDTGILQDATAYQPPRMAEGFDAVPEVRPTPLPERGGAGGAEAAVRTAVANLVNAVRDGEVTLALRAFRSEDVRLLAEQSELLFATFATLDTLGRHLKGSFDPTKISTWLAKVRGVGGDLPRWELLDPQNASVTPNPAALLLGPTKATPVLRLVLDSGQWRFRLDAPLTKADVDAIVAYHQELQEQLGRIIDWVARTSAVDEATLSAALDAAVAGQAVELPAAAPPPEATPPPAEEDEEPPPTPRPGRGVRQPGT